MNDLPRDKPGRLVAEGGSDVSHPKPEARISRETITMGAQNDQRPTTSQDTLTPYFDDSAAAVRRALARWAS